MRKLIIELDGEALPKIRNWEQYGQVVIDGDADTPVKQIKHLVTKAQDAGVDVWVTDNLDNPDIAWPQEGPAYKEAVTVRADFRSA